MRDARQHRLRIFRRDQGFQLAADDRDLLARLAPALRQQLPGLQSRLATPTEQAPPALLPARWADDPDYQCLWRALDHNPSSMDSLITRCGLTAPQLSSMLLAMELAGIVVCPNRDQQGIRLARCPGRTAAEHVPGPGRWPRARLPRPRAGQAGRGMPRFPAVSGTARHP
ncbi:hypothetical protein G6F65_018785 [Rhizopus arrhizus]|nr:hypothetical protein G6F65_018785 [Rhizopus arrhizus]